MAEAGGRAASQQEGPGLGIRTYCVERWQGSTSADDSCELVKHLAPFPEQVTECGVTRHLRPSGFGPTAGGGFEFSHSPPVTARRRSPWGPRGAPTGPAPVPSCRSVADFWLSLLW